MHHIHQLVIVIHGRLQANAEGTGPCALEPTNALLIPPLVRHQFRADESAQCVSFKFQLANEYWLLLGRKPGRTSVGRNLFKQLRAWVRRFRRNEILAEQEAQVLTAECLITMARTRLFSRVRPDRNRMRVRLWHLLETVTNHPYASWSIDTLAHEVHLPATRLKREFRAVLNQTPRDFVFEIKMRAAAAELVENPDQSIKAIAEKAGYATIPAFTRAFTTLFKLTPGACRQTASQHLIGRTL
jgi:AraC-like DNA-binding protein